MKNFTPRARLIEYAASQLRRNGGEVTPNNAHAALENVCFHNSTCAAYYFGITQTALERLVNATVKRANEQIRHCGGK